MGKWACHACRDLLFLSPLSTLVLSVSVQLMPHQIFAVRLVIVPLVMLFTYIFGSCRHEQPILFMPLISEFIYVLLCVCVRVRVFVSVCRLRRWRQTLKYHFHKAHINIHTHSAGKLISNRI